MQAGEHRGLHHAVTDGQPVPVVAGRNTLLLEFRETYGRFEQGSGSGGLVRAKTLRIACRERSPNQYVGAWTQLLRTTGFAPHWCAR